MPSEDRFAITLKGRELLIRGIQLPREGQEGHVIEEEQDFSSDVDFGILRTLGEFEVSDYETLVLENLGGIKWRDPASGRWMSRIVGEGDVRTSIRRLYEHGLIEKVD